MKPILVLQMQRMGDLILSFPLFLWLSRIYSKLPVWTVAEKVFFRDLMPVSPKVVYIPWDNYDFVLKERFSLVINLSHRREAAWLAGQLDAEEKIGPYLDKDGCKYIAGKWQLYRASLVHNNRHNRFHWADLNALDVVPYEVIQKTVWPSPRRLPQIKKVGLFLGASEKSKRPSSRFWAHLANQLIKQGLRPVLLGGTLEKELAERVKSVLGINLLDLTGKLTLSQLAKIGQTLQLLVTPDTGPMHLAAWTGLRVLNLSMGPVNPWETGPYQPGHIVTCARISCSFCWQCKFNDTLCKSKFHPRKVNDLVIQIIRGNDIEKINGLRLFISSRQEGLYHLAPYPLPRTSYPVSITPLLNDLWHCFWGYYFGLWSERELLAAADSLAKEYPIIAECFLRSLFLLLSKVNNLIRSGHIPPHDFWLSFPPMLRPLTSYLQLFWQNSEFSPFALKSTIALLENFYAILQI
jgi:ADP-heptose:LPS heptosyltransferase